MSSTASSKTIAPQVVSQDQWLEARKQLLKKEKEFTKLRDELSQERRELPWEKVEKQYTFQGPKGKETLAELFHGRRFRRLRCSRSEWDGDSSGFRRREAISISTITFRLQRNSWRRAILSTTSKCRASLEGRNARAPACITRMEAVKFFTPTRRIHEVWTF